MSKINQIGYGPVPALNKTQATRPGARPPEVSQTNKTGGDRVEISEKARFLSQIAAMPEIRQDKIDAIRQKLADGTYDYEGKLSEALDTLMQEHSWE